MGAGKFLGHLVTRRGIEADPNQVTAVTNLKAPSTIRDVQKLTGMATALNRFISRSSDKCYTFQLLKGSRRHFQWTPECDKALVDLKGYLSSAPLLVTPKDYEDLYLYLAVSPHVVSSTLVRRSGAVEEPIYFSNKTLLPAQTRYLPLEKLALALVSAARKLLLYFQTHTIVVLTEHSLKTLFRKADHSNRVSQWVVEPANFDIHYKPRTTIKG